jgi:predicted  nucleic acid-binding Zn-ribbon protein
VRWWAPQDSNLRPAGYEPAALTAELGAPRGHDINLRPQYHNTAGAIRKVVCELEDKISHVIQALASLVALQALDTAADAARKRLAELPAAEKAIDDALAAATAALDGVKGRLHENQTVRRALEKDVAIVDTRLAKFDAHKAAVKTNQEYTALLHEIATAKQEKDAIEEKILVLMENADALSAELKADERAVAEKKKAGDQARAAIAAERGQLDAELKRLAHERTGEVRGVDAPLLARYEQLLKQRRGLAVARMNGELCTACHVRLRPHVTQQIRRNDEIVACESCQRLLYYVEPAPGS